jgi:hypothetical protein
MIDIDKTISLRGYDPLMLTYGSGREVWVICNGCGDGRWVSYCSYKDLCFKCVMADPKTRKKMSDAAIKYNKDNPEIAKERGKILKQYYIDNPEILKLQSEYMKKLCNDPEYKKLQSKRAIQWHIDHPECAKNHSEMMLERCNDPEWRKDQSNKLCQYYADNPDAIKAMSEIAIQRHIDHPEIAKGQGEKLKQFYIDNPEVIRRMSKAAIERCKDPEYLNEMSEIMIQYHKNHPEMAERLSARNQDIPYDEWQGFVDNNEYCDKFDDECRESNREKYDRCCFLCGKDELGENRRLSVHHVDMNKDQGCNDHEWKLVPLCRSCHSKAHSKLWQARIEWLLKNIYIMDVIKWY